MHTPSIKHAKYSVDLTNASWHKARASNASGSCVEVAFVEDVIAVRDSKDKSREALIFNKKEWRAFLDGVHNSEFELPK